MLTGVCRVCGTDDRFPKGQCRTCAAGYALRKQQARCGGCGELDRYPNGVCRVCAKQRAHERRKPCPQCGSAEKLKSGHCIPCLAAQRAAPCGVCGENERRKDGTCVVCARRKTRRWQAAHPDLVREQRRRQRTRHPDKVRERKMRYLAKHPGAQNRWREKTPGMGRAHRLVADAIRRGELIRPTICEECGVAGKITAAHFNYTEPLRVRWLCRRCHSLWDMAEPKSARVPVQLGMC